MGPFFKIDRVSSVEEARLLDRAEVALISVSLIEDFRFSDKRTISLKKASEIKKCLNNAKLCGEIGPEHWSSKDFVSRAKQIGFDYVQISGGGTPGPNFKRDLHTSGIGIIFSGIEVSYDDDPSWILSRYKDDDVMASFFQLDLLPDMESSWDFFKKECPKYPENLQLKDINDLAAKSPLIVTTDLKKGNIHEIATFLPFVKGLSMILGSKPKRRDLHFFGFNEAIETVTHFRV